MELNVTVKRSSSSLNCWSCPLLWWWTHQQLGTSHPTCQLLASFLLHSWSTWWKYCLELILARLPAIVWQCWKHRSGTAWHGRRHLGECWNRSVADSKSGASTGICAPQHPHIGQGVQCTDPREAWDSSGKSECQPYSVVHGKRLGPPVKPCGNHCADSCPTCSEPRTRGHLGHLRLGEARAALPLLKGTVITGLLISKTDTSWPYQSVAHLPGIKKALRKQGVCVNHLNRCKTSFCCFSWICFLPNNQLQGAQAHCGYLCQRSYSTMGEAEIDHLRVPASAKPRTGMSFFSNIFQTKLQLEDLLSMLDVCTVFTICQGSQFYIQPGLWRSSVLTLTRVCSFTQSCQVWLEYFCMG